MRNLRKELENKFNSQHPEAKYSLRNYTVKNWPDGVDMFKAMWNRQEITAIRAKMDDFIFVKREVPYNLKTEFGLNDLGDLKDVLDPSMSHTATNEFLIKRFREETGNLTAKRIDWSLLDRQDIPSRYDDCAINGTRMRLNTLYKNPEIVYNIHFSRKDKNSNCNERESHMDDERISKRPRNV